jgi:hypothetical protein
VAKPTAAKRKVTKRKVTKRKRRKATARQVTKGKVTKGEQAAAKPAAAVPTPAIDPFEIVPVLESSPAAGEFSLHELFQQQTMAMLERSDLDEEQKQGILVAMNCPCCGGSGLSFTVKLKRKR